MYIYVFPYVCIYFLTRFKSLKLIGMRRYIYQCNVRVEYMEIFLHRHTRIIENKAAFGAFCLKQQRVQQYVRFDCALVCHDQN